MTVNTLKDMFVKAVKAHAHEKAMRLRAAFARATSEDKETLLAGIEFHEFVRDACQDTVDEPCPL